ncbi:thioredoxin domain-containing protein [Magnetospira thiophila]
MRPIGLCVVLTLLFASPVRAVPLEAANSPYLALHEHDLVRWHGWDPDTLALARQEGKPIFLSIGYLACHWCHVMQDEHFRDPETADMINRWFIPILVDREHRPEVDAFYMQAAARLGLSTGWPLNLFLTGDGTPFFGGVYFPPEPRQGMPSLRQILTRVATTHAANPGDIREQGRNLIAALGQIEPTALPGLSKTASALMEQRDSFNGGFGTAPKYPHLAALDLLWRAAIRQDRADWREAVIESLDAMLRGGLHDHVGGGFYRYCVDAPWREPHYEKMLDVNAAMLRLMTRVWKETHDPVLEQAIRNTVRFLLDDMGLPDGGFASSLDADSRSPRNGRMTEGAFYAWRESDIRRVLGTWSDGFFASYGLTSEESGGVLFRHGEALRPEDLALLRAARQQRPAPRRDDKLLADWNAMAAAALAEAGVTLGEMAWITAAEQTLAVLWDRLIDGRGAPTHALYLGKAAPPALLDDLANGIDAALTLYDITGQAPYLAQAREMAERALLMHEDRESGGFFATAHDQPLLPVRLKPMQDHPNASGNALIVEGLARLYYLTGQEPWRVAADRTLAAFSGDPEQPLRHAALVAAADTLSHGLQVVLVGERQDPATQVLLRHVFALDLPGRILQVLPPQSSLPEGHPARDKPQVAGRPTAYVCRGPVCSLPVTDAVELAETLKDLRQLPTSGR